MKKLSQSGELNEDTMLQIMAEQKKPERTDNFYAVLERQDHLDREVYQIVHGKKADPRRKKTDRGRHRQSEQDG